MCTDILYPWLLLPESAHSTVYIISHTSSYTSVSLFILRDIVKCLFSFALAALSHLDSTIIRPIIIYCEDRKTLQFYYVILLLILIIRKIYIELRVCRMQIIMKVQIYPTSHHRGSYRDNSVIKMVTRRPRGHWIHAKVVHFLQMEGAVCVRGTRRASDTAPIGDGCRFCRGSDPNEYHQDQQFFCLVGPPLVRTTLPPHPLGSLELAVGPAHPYSL